jgi:RNA polymerase-interacting CarD/CdnL/TRCF family regulator
MKAYNDFATELFAENTTATDRTAYHNMLVYISVELAGLTDISEKNAVKYLQKAIDIVDRQMEFVRWQMQLETTAQKCPFTHLSPEHSKLKWTGNVVEWVELIYTLYSVNRINNGETSLKELFEQIGGIFDFEVKEFANYFMNIKNRVDGHRTKFMDLLKDAVLERMEDADRKSSRK